MRTSKKRGSIGRRVRYYNKQGGGEGVIVARERSEWGDQWKIKPDMPVRKDHYIYASQNALGGFDFIDHV